MSEEIHPMRAWREAMGLSQDQVAKRLGCTQMMVSKIESFERKPGGELSRLIDEMTDAAVSRHWLRPDIFGKAPIERDGGSAAA